jgi:hypothetical protein
MPRVLRVLALLTILTAAIAAESARPSARIAADPTADYQAVKAFSLAGGAVDVTNFTLAREQTSMTFTGTFYLTAPVSGHVTGAVFIGQGSFHADPPASSYEKDNIRRMLGADVVESDFHTAVIRMTDDTAALIQQATAAGGPVRTLAAGAMPPQATDLAAKFDTRVLHDTGLNLPARLALSLANEETPGVFFAEFDGGRRGRFDVIEDMQGRVPASTFGIDGGEKGLVFTSQPATGVNDVWEAFYSKADLARGTAVYGDSFNLVDITHYDVDADVRSPGSHLGLKVHMDMKALAPHLRMIPFRLGESLGTFGDARLKKQLRVKSAKVNGQDAPFVQEDWEGGFSILLPQAVETGATLGLDVTADGNFMNPDTSAEYFYPASNEAWLPRHGELDRATFDLAFHSNKRHKVASVGTRVSEGADPSDKDAVLTKYTMPEPIALATFAVGQFQRSERMVNWEKGGAPIPIEFNGIASNTAQINSNFMLDEMDNAVRYFAFYFGKYPYPAFRAAIHPYPFGQGFATFLMLPPADANNVAVYQFISHETSHQWWGNIVAWRSYRDQWLSEGFADYSGMLYAAARDKTGQAFRLITNARDALLQAPRTTLGIGSGKLNDIGPIILGRRLIGSKTTNAYQTLVYSKGALVLRMLHFLLSNPSTGDDKGAFFATMTDFVTKYRNGAASTDDFKSIASAHFAPSPIAQKYGLSNLDWLFDEYVYDTPLPSYTLEYALADQPDGSCMVTGTLHQDNVPNKWAMFLPIVFTLKGGAVARTSVAAIGPASTVQLKLPSHPQKVELDPQQWILSEKTTVKGK